MMLQVNRKNHKYLFTFIDQDLTEGDFNQNIENAIAVVKEATTNKATITSEVKSNGGKY